MARGLGELSARELDRLAGLREGHTALIEAGTRPNVEAKTAARLAGVLGLDLNWFLTGVGREPSKRAVGVAVEASRASYAGGRTGTDGR